MCFNFQVSDHPVKHWIMSMRQWKFTHVIISTSKQNLWSCVLPKSLTCEDFPTVVSQNGLVMLRLSISRMGLSKVQNHQQISVVVFFFICPLIRGLVDTAAWLRAEGIAVAIENVGIWEFFLNVTCLCLESSHEPYHVLYTSSIWWWIADVHAMDK